MIDSADLVSASQRDIISSTQNAGQPEQEQSLSKHNGSSKRSSAVDDENDLLEATAYLQYSSMMADTLSDSVITFLNRLLVKTANHMPDVKEFHLPHFERKTYTRYILQTSVASTRNRPVHPYRSFFPFGGSIGAISNIARFPDSINVNGSEKQWKKP